MATDPPADLKLTPVQGRGRTLSEWLTTFHLALVVLDPYTNESSWVLPAAARILRTFDGADVRVAWLVAADADGATAFLGPLASDYLTFTDPDRAAIKALGLAQLPAFVFLEMDGSVQASAEGWHPLQWRAVTERMAATTSWLAPLVPGPADPRPFDGTMA